MKLFGERRQSEAATALWIKEAQDNPKRFRAALATALQIGCVVEIEK